MPPINSLAASAERQEGPSATGTTPTAEQVATAAAMQQEQPQPGEPGSKRGQIHLPAVPQQKGSVHGRPGSRKAKASGVSTGGLNLKRTQRSGT